MTYFNLSIFAKSYFYSNFNEYFLIQHVFYIEFDSHYFIFLIFDLSI